MPKDTLSLGLDGDVSLADFSEAMKHFRGLVEGLSAEVGDRKTEWVIHDLHAGSALATIRAAVGDADAIERTIRAYLSVGRALSEGHVVPYSRRIVRAAEAIAGLLNGKIASARFETPEEQVVVFGAAARGATDVHALVAQGAIEGIVQTLSSRAGLRFTLYDRIHDRAVSCYLEPGQEDLMRDVWGHLARVEGMITRDALSGRPVIIRQITRVTKLDMEPSDYRSARGAVPIEEGMPMPEDAIRHWRDA